MYIFSSLLTFCHIYTNAQMNFLKSSSHSIELLDYMQYLKLLSWMPLVLSCHHHRLLMISACRRNAQEILFATMKNRLHYYFFKESHTFLFFSFNGRVHVYFTDFLRTTPFTNDTVTNVEFESHTGWKKAWTKCNVSRIHHSQKFPPIFINKRVVVEEVFFTQ